MACAIIEDPGSSHIWSSVIIYLSAHNLGGEVNANEKIFFMDISCTFYVVYYIYYYKIYDSLSIFIFPTRIAVANSNGNRAEI